MFGIAESYNREDYGPEQLEDVLANCLTAGTDRDILSGWSGVVYIMYAALIEGLRTLLMLKFLSSSKFNYENDALMETNCLDFVIKGFRPSQRNK